MGCLIYMLFVANMRQEHNIKLEEYFINLNVYVCIRLRMDDVITYSLFSCFSSNTVRSPQRRMEM